MISNPITGAGYFLQGLGLLNKRGVRRFVILPLLINILLFSLMWWLAANQFGTFIDTLMPSLPDWLSWLSWLLWLVFAITGGIIMFFSFTLVANLVGAPFNSYLAAAVEAHLNGTKPVSDKTFAQELRDALLGELRKWLYYLIWIIPLLIISLIPGINLISPILWVIFSAWMMAIEYADYPLGNHGLTFPQIRTQLGNKRVLSLGFGGITMAATLIPLFNLLVMPVAVAGATAMRLAQFPLPADRKEVV